MSIEYTVAQLKLATEEKKIIWYLQCDGSFTSSYKTGDNEFSLSLLRSYENLIILNIELKNIMKTEICQRQGTDFLLPNSPGDRLLKKFRKTKNSQMLISKNSLNSDLDAIYNLADKSAIRPEESQKILLKLISGF